MITTLTEDNFKEFLMNSSTPILIYFSAEWCAFCKKMSHTIKQVDDVLGNKLVLIHIDTDNCPNITKEYKIRSLPTFILYRKIDSYERKSGVIALGDMLEWIEG